MSVSFREIVRREMKRQGLSGYRLAKLANLNLRGVQAYVAGERDMVGERLAKVCKALGLELKPKRRTKGR